MEPDYSTYRLQLKSLKPDLDEKQIYQMYNGVMKPGRRTQTTPYLAEDGYYHGLYLTECLDDGRIYVGKHSTNNLDDGYQGSGYEISDGKNLGKKFRTTWLEFFDSSDQAYVAEKGIVNANFIRNQKLVMNHVLGGKHLDDAKHLDEVKTSATKPESAKKPELFKPQNPDRVEVKGRPAPPPVWSPTVFTSGKHFIIFTKSLAAEYTSRLVRTTVGFCQRKRDEGSRYSASLAEKSLCPLPVLCCI